MSPAQRVVVAAAAVIVGIGAWSSLSTPDHTPPSPPTVRTFVEADFLWDDRIQPYKDLIIASVNKIHREVEGCLDLDPTSAYWTSEESTSDAQMFFVTCGTGAHAFNVYFSKDGIESVTQRSTVKNARTVDDADRLSALGRIAVESGVATEYDLSVWSGALDLTISSILPGDARAVADAVCTASNQQFGGQWERTWELRVFILTSSERPAAVCQL